MKKRNILKVFGIIAVIAVIGLSMASCGEEILAEILVENYAVSGTITAKLYLVAGTFSPSQAAFKTAEGVAAGERIRWQFNDSSVLGNSWVVSVTPASGSEIFYKVGTDSQTVFKVYENDEVVFQWHGTSLSKK